MDFLQRLASADVFWSTAALAQVALMIALVLEGRTAQEDYERLHERTRRWHAREAAVWYEWQTTYPQRLEAWREERARNADLPKPVKPDRRRVYATQPDTSIAGKRAVDVQVTVFSVALLSLGTIIALLVLVPATYPGPWWIGLALGVEALAVVEGFVALVIVLARRAMMWQVTTRATRALPPTLDELLDMRERK